MDDQSFLPQGEGVAVAEEQQPLIPVSEPAPVVRVPRNATEVAAQAVYALDKDGNFRDLFAKSTVDIKANGVGPTLSEVLVKEHADKIEAAKQSAEAFFASKQAEQAMFAAKQAAELEKKGAPRADDNGLEGNQLLSARALERLAFKNARALFGNLDAFDAQLGASAGDVAARNVLGQVENKLDKEASWFDVLGSIGRSVFLPFWDDANTVKAINKAIGTNFGLFSKYDAVVGLRNYFLGIHSDAERENIVQRIVSELSTNKDVAAKAIRDIATITRGDANADFGFNAVQVVDTGSILFALSKVARRGLPIKAVKDLAGEEEAGKLLATDIMTKAGITGLDDAEKLARAIAAGVNPMEADPAKTLGLSAAAQTQLRDGWQTILKALDERLTSSTLTPDEIADSAARIRASYMPDTNKRVYHVTFGEATADGQKMEVYWQGKGKPFATERAARKWADEQGLVGYEVVPKNALDEAASLKHSPFVDGDGLPDMVEPTFSMKPGEDVLHALKSRGDISDVVDFFGEQADIFKGSKLGSSLVDTFHKAFLTGKTNISARSALELIAKNGEADAKFLAKTLLGKKGIDWNKLPVGMHNILDDAGKYIPAVDRVSLDITHLDSAEVVLHELIHGHSAQVTTLALKQPKLAEQVLTKGQIAAAKELQKLWTGVRTKVNDAVYKDREAKGGMFEKFDWHSHLAAVESPEELLAWGLTNKEVRKFLNETSLSSLGYAGKERSVWSALWETFSKILGFDNDKTAMAKLSKVYDDLLKNIETSGQRTVLNGLKDAGAITTKDINRLIATPLAARRKSAAKPQFLVKQTRNDPLSYDSIGKFSDKDVQSMPWIAVDPKHGASELGVEARVIGVHAEAKVQKALVDFITPYYRGLNKDSKARVRSLLEEGDSFSNTGSVGKEFTYTEATGKGLSDKEALAYLATRQLRMAMYHIRNGEMVRHLRAQGMREIEFLGTAERTVGKVVDSPSGMVYDLSSKTYVDAAKLGGQDKVVRLAKPMKIDDELRSLVVVNDKTGRVKDITTALHYRPGEYSRIYSDEYFITLKRNVKVDGVTKEVVETVRTAASSREATEFTQGLTAAVAAMRSGKATDDVLEDLIGNYFKVDEFKDAYARREFDDITGFDWHYTRNKDEYLNGSVNEALANGRLFTSKRSDRLYSVDANRENTLGVFESLEAEITSVSRVANITQWRESMVRRWMNSFGDYIPNRTGDDVADFFSAAGASFTKGGGKDALFAERTHKYVMRQIGLRTNEEQYYENITRRMTEGLFSGNEKVETIGAKIREMSVLGFLRNINFNFTLGMFNPAQLIVQANGAATAMILSPLHGVAAAKTFIPLRMALMSDNPAVWKHFATVDKLTSLGLSSADEFVNLVKAVRQTGIIDNIKSTALYNREEGRLNIFNSYPSRVLGSHTFFFNRGEEFSRLVSFDIARREFMASNKEIAWNSKEGLAKIVVRMDDLTQNMTKANLARFQEGAASIPLQFAQYNIKLGMNIMSALLGKGEGRGFTKPEALQLLAGHVLLYGAAGNGLTWLVDEMLPASAKDSMSVDQKIYLAQGLMGGVINQVGEAITGERTAIAVGSRLGSFDYYQKLADAVFTDPKNVYEALLGPSLNTAKRIGVVGEVAALWMKDPDLTARDVMEGLSRMTSEQVATLRNVTKAYLYMTHQNKLIDGKGVTTAQLTTPEVLAQALGFASAASVDVSNLIKSKKDHTEALTDLADTIFKVQKDIMTARMRGDNAYADEQHKLLAALWPANTGDLFEVQRLVRDRLFPYDSDMQKLLGEYLYKGQTYKQPTVVTTEPRKE